MPKLPVISGRNLIRVLGKIGYLAVRQKGSHVRLRHETEQHKPLTVPLHPVIRPGLLHQIIKDADLTLNEFLKLL